MSAWLLQNRHTIRKLRLPACCEEAHPLIERASLHVTDMPALEMTTAKLNHPEGGGQPGDCQTKPKVQALNPGQETIPARAPSAA